MLTPFTEQDQVDEQALDAMLDLYLEAGVAGIFVNCLSSEVFHLSPDEQLQIVRKVLEKTDGRIPVVAGANFGCLPASLDAGAAGFCGIAANVCPELCVGFCRPESAEAHRRDIVKSLSGIVEIMMSHEYPISAKYILNRRGIPITNMCRAAAAGDFTSEDRRAIDEFLDGVDFPATSVFPKGAIRIRDA